MSTTHEAATVVLVQGCFQTPLVYQQLVEGLKSLGYPTVHPDLPSCSNTDSPAFPSVTLADDASAIHHELSRLIKNEGKTVMVVMHSYGGLVGSEAVSEELSFSKREAQGLPGGVIHLFYITAFLLAEGQSVLDTFGEGPNNDVQPDGRFYMKNGANTLYSDLPPSEAALWASRLIPQSHLVQSTKLTRAAYKYIPSTYLICENDHAAPPQHQEMFAASANAHVERCSSGHSPMLSQPDMLVRKIGDALEKAVARKEE